MQHNPTELARILASATTPGADPIATDEVMAEVDALFAAHRDHVYAICYRFVGNPERALDLAQDTLLKAYLKLPTFRGDAKFSTWLTSIARYECLNALRKGRDLLTEDGVLDATDPTRSALSRLRVQEREELLRMAAADVLEPDEQEAVYLRYTEHVPLAQIETILEIEGASGARGVLQRCKRKLSRALRHRLEQMGHGTSFLRDSNG